MLAAIAHVDRESMGFTPLPGDEAIYRIESKSRKGYDAMLHIDGATRRTIAFRKTETGYRWIHEQEIHTGPKEFESPDGRFRETIVVTYETTPISGRPLSKLQIIYDGEDERLKQSAELTLEQIRPILEEWRRARSSMPEE